MAKKALISGITGQDGSYLAESLLSKGYEVHGIIRRASTFNTDRIDHLYQDPHVSNRNFVLHYGDMTDSSSLVRIIQQVQPDEIYNLAAQSHVAVSFDEPEYTANADGLGALRLLEALRRRREPVPLVFASTNKVYGDLADIPLERRDGAYAPRDAAIRAHGIGEDRPIVLHTPYGCSKGGADQYVLDYARSYGLPTVVFRMSCIYGPRQMGTEDQGWVAHFLIRALRGEPITIYGDGCQVRDIMFVQDAVTAYLAAWRRIGAIGGRAFNLGGGPANAVSLRQVIAEIGALTGRRIDLRHGAWRPGDQRWYVSDARRAAQALDLAPATPWRTGLAALARYLAGERAPAQARVPGEAAAACGR